ncbi:nucleoside-diphosphate sugar epimerase/dehydratase [Mucilaginibacter sp. OK283]|uniref:polysaccharide biosynthesis protein n=1 Tax=Mucilaginibacter sp. OK283 TaxID=1881049 RepID=UPI0008B8BB71|nr:nucleoside-diphosphate sugar epimerase/dehydratase [Mucilaginibacter sp. OK283]SEP39768.1 NDP-sugar epimerase, includes UDP-GlcNAc-inverting 4,6-dehydratase FlaA1 and capsular polysaccharide biosynthesis protein EpsC [Mucilaginibacter sp. OK283]
MIYLRNLLFQDKFHSRWLILLTDLGIVLISLCLSFSVKGKLDLEQNNLYYIAFYCSNAVFIFLVMRVHTHIIRHSNTRDMLRILTAVFVSTVAFVIIYHLVFATYLNINLQGLGDVLFINFFISSSLLMGMRIVIKDVFKYFDEPGYKIEKENVLIYGSGTSSILIKNTLEGQRGFMINVQGFIDTGDDKVYKCLEQKRVYPITAITRLNNKYGIKKMFITSEDIQTEGKRTAIAKCVELGIKVITVPPSNEWINGQPNLKQFKDLKIEDLLERKPIKLSCKHIFDDIQGKRVLVTGAAGSIGSELVRQILGYEPEFVVLCDQAETPLHEIQLEIEEGIHADKARIFIANIQNETRIKSLFELYRPQIVFHAAAYKHVPMMENNPTEAVLTNIGGTKNLADISVLFGVEKFVMISTDKAVRPTNVMGASKRIAEMYIQSLNSKTFDNRFFCSDLCNGVLNQTKFITTRFGNVMGSNGSVIPRFKAQIEKGGPVTVTHPEITRYFMTIPEAVQLVIEAAIMGNGGEIFLFDMGLPVKIADLAANMIKLVGMVPGEDIKIVYTGLRPGEKLYEELLNIEEEVIPTYNKDIKISKTIPVKYADVNKVVNELLELNLCRDIDLMVAKMKNILPDFISNNSRYEKLDARIPVSIRC